MTWYWKRPPELGARGVLCGENMRRCESSATQTAMLAAEYTKETIMSKPTCPTTEPEMKRGMSLLRLGPGLAVQAGLFHLPGQPRVVRLLRRPHEASRQYLNT